MSIKENLKKARTDSKHPDNSTLVKKALLAICDAIEELDRDNQILRQELNSLRHDEVR